MEKINDYELQQICGGGFNIGLGFIIGAGISFIIGVVDGFLRPLSCR